MERLATHYYAIIVGAVFVATGLVLGFLAVFSESVLGTSFPNISPTRLLAFFAVGIFLIGFGSKLLLSEEASKGKTPMGKTGRLARGVAELTKPRYLVVAETRGGQVKRFSVRGLDVFDVMSAIKSRLGTTKQFYRLGPGKYADADDEWTVHITEAPAVADVVQSASADTLASMIGRGPSKGKKREEVKSRWK